MVRACLKFLDLDSGVKLVSTALTFLTSGEYLRDQVKFDPFQTSERLQTFGNLIFMIFLHLINL